MSRSQLFRSTVMLAARILYIFEGQRFEVLSVCNTSPATAGLQPHWLGCYLVDSCEYGSAITDSSWGV